MTAAAATFRTQSSKVDAPSRRVLEAGAALLIPTRRPSTLDAMSNANVAADQADIAAAKNGDESALSRLIYRHQQHVASIMWRFTRDKAAHAELVHDVFVEAYLSLKSYRGDAPFPHWLARIAVRTGYRFWKRQRATYSQSDLSDKSGLPDSFQNRRATPVDTLAAIEAAEYLHRLLATLPPRDRLVLTMHYLEERSVRETADLLGWSETMVKVQLWRARAKLQKTAEKLT